VGYTKTIVCLANSWKRLGRCVAGREITPEGFGGWIRPISARPDGELNDDEQRCTGGTDAALLDVVEIPFLRPQPEEYQRENHLIDPALCWTKRGAVTWNDLQAAVEDPAGPLWPNGHSSSHGLSDQVPVDLLAEQTRSLYLVRPERLEIVVMPEDVVAGPSRLRVRAEFSLSGHDYRLAVTDPWVVDEYLAKGQERTPVGEALLCVSLGEVYHGCAYKLAAAVIPAPGEAATGVEVVYTIGHSNHTVEGLIALLAGQGITAVADVRSRPYSRHHAQFNREGLRQALKAAGIAYVFLGRELGARPEDPACYEHGTVRYDLLAASGPFREGLKRVIEGSKKHRIALLCAEKDPLHCHRAILVSRHLAARGATVLHIREDGRLESHDDALERLLDECGVRQMSLFGGSQNVSHEGLIEAAYRERGDKIAYTETVLAAEENGEGEDA
jgi:hypothetical protein